MSKILKFILCVLFCFVFAFSVQAANVLDVAINEIAWMGTEVSYNDEWIELYNNIDSPVSLDGWILQADDGTPIINLAGTVPANGFYLLERTDDDTLPKILADRIYKGSLGNSRENLKLYDGDGNLIDSVDCSKGWFAGDNKTKQTMERKSQDSPGTVLENWQTSEHPGGTPKAKNSEQETVNNKQLTSTENGSLPSQSQEIPATYPSNIFINEVLPSPEGPDAEEEWIEIFNKNEFEIDLSGWKIQDTAGKTNTYTFPKNTRISANGFFVLGRPTSKIILNNDGDGLKLINPNGEIVDEVSYPKAEKGKSYNKTPLESSSEDLTGRADSGWVRSSSLTPGAQNIIPTQNLEVGKEKSSEFAEGKGLAAIGEQISKETSFFPLLIASGIAIFSSIIILILKKTLLGLNKPSKKIE